MFKPYVDTLIWAAQSERELSATLYEHGIDDQGFARIRSKGDKALFGGLYYDSDETQTRYPRITTSI